MLENGVDLYVNERQKIRHYRARSAEERRRKEKKKNAKSIFFYFARCVRKLAQYSNVLHSFDWKASTESMMRISIYLLTTTPTSNTHRFH